MDRLVDHLFVFEGNGEIRDFPGNYTQYRIWQKDNEKSANKWDLLEAGKRKGATTESLVMNEQAKTNEQSKSAASNKRALTFKEKREFEQLEKDMPELEKEKQSLTLEMSTGTLAFDAIQKISDRLIVITNQLEEKELRWLELSELV
jgi:ATP-binding cassette subfamily F protein uup